MGESSINKESYQMKLQADLIMRISVYLMAMRTPKAVHDLRDAASLAKTCAAEKTIR
jgi:hypothetical protein